MTDRRIEPKRLRSLGEIDEQLSTAGVQGPALLCTVDEAAELLRIGRTNLYRLLNLGELRSVKIGGRRLVPRQFLDEYVKSLIDEAA